jgi:hypothetical protein
MSRLLTAVKMLRIPSNTRYTAPVCMAISGAVMALDGREVAWSKWGTMDDGTLVFGAFQRRASGCGSEIRCMFPRSVILAECRLRNMHLRARLRWFLFGKKGGTK